MIDFIDEEEKEIIESLYSENWISVLNDTNKNMFVESSKLNKSDSKKISIQVSQRDFHKIQAKALEQGIPYQTMISMLIHKFNEGKIAITV